MKKLVIWTLIAVATISAISAGAHADSYSKTSDYKKPRSIMPGLLIGSGVPKGYGGMSLPEESVMEFCEQGVTKAFYLYPGEKFSTRDKYNCGAGTIDYTGGAFRGDGTREVLEAIYNAANKGEKVLVHCWNGSHATGEIIALALKQFCGYSDSDAANYWKQNIHDKFQSKYESILKRIRNFETFSDLNFSSSQRAKFCP